MLGICGAVALCSQLPAINEPIERAFVSLGARDAVCGAYLAALELIRDDPASSCTSALFGALVFAIVALVFLSASQVISARKHEADSFNVVTPTIFAGVGIYFGAEARSPELDASGEWSAITSLFFLGAAIATTIIPLVSAWSRRRSRPT